MSLAILKARIECGWCGHDGGTVDVVETWNAVRFGGRAWKWTDERGNTYAGGDGYYIRCPTGCGGTMFLQDENLEELRP